MSDRIQVLDKGWIELEDRLGGDATVVRAARICYQSTGSSYEADVRLIQRLMAADPKHNTVFEHVVFRFHVKCPLFVARQWLRHRIGTFNEKSLRYCEATPDYYVPKELDHILRAAYIKQIEDTFDFYQTLLELGVKREQARAVLPLATYTEFIWTVNAWSLMNWLHKRMDKAAQWEHRQYAEQVYEIFEETMPVTAVAFSHAYFAEVIE